LPGAGGGGGARGGGASGALVDTVEEGLEAGRGGGFFRPATKGLIGGAGGECVVGRGGGGLDPGGLGADAADGWRVSPSDI
jgi:hypothetical protein